MQVCLEVLKDEISEGLLLEKRLHRHILVLYLNSCDVKHMYDQDLSVIQPLNPENVLI